MGRMGNLVVFAREPRLGRVKRRLAHDIGGVPATFWYRRQVAALLHRLRRGPWNRNLFVEPPTAVFTKAWPSGWALKGQTRGNIGYRMHRALVSFPHGPVVLIGSDIPGVGHPHIQSAFRALRRADLVIGPALDGGFWLIGTSGRRQPPVLDPVRWSTEHALTDTLACLGKRNRVVLLETLRDVDRGTDLYDERPWFSCSSNRGIISTKLQGLNRISS